MTINPTFIHINMSKFKLSARIKSFYFAGRGIAYMLRSQHNAWIHALATVLAVALGLLCGITTTEWCIILLAIMAVWTAETVNTALEFLADVTSPDFHPLVARAKDVAAGAVLITAACAGIIGLIVFLPYLAL